jgi:branched-chain amino acid aminotransferase
MKLVPAERIWLDGRLVAWDEARIHVLSHVVHYGTGVFEGLRAYGGERGTRVLGLRQHVRRMLASCRILDMRLPYGEEELCSAILETVRVNRHESCYIRPLAFRGYGVMGVDPTPNPVQVAIATWPLGRLLGNEAIEQGIDVCVSSWRRMAPDTHPAMAKAVGNYLNSALIVAEARRNGYAEGLALDVDGYVSEGSGENLFLVREGRLWTPPQGSSILVGITRGFVLQLARELDLPVVETRIPREMLYAADELFLSGTAAEITPVRSVDRRPIGSGERGPLTARLQAAFFELTSGRAEDRHEWLTPVAPG